MARIVGIGIAGLDIINTTDGYPQEDSEVRASTQALCRGGNVTNTLVVLSQYGHQCIWGGTLGNDPGKTIIEQDLRRHDIDMTRARVVAHGQSPTSCITLNQHSGSRTIVHYRNLPEFGLPDFLSIDLTQTDWLHFEGRNVHETQEMIRHAREAFPSLPVSVEIEKPRPDIECLFHGADILFFSRHYATHKGFNSAQQLLEHTRPHITDSTPVLVCTWGDQGAYALTGNTLSHANTVPPEQTVDTIGAGDTFNAGFIHSYLTQQDVETALTQACALAGKKCGQFGFEGLVPQ